MENSKKDKKIKNKKDNEVVDKKKQKLQKKESFKDKKQKFANNKVIPEIKTPEVHENKNIELCSSCLQNNSKLFNMKCTSNHYICFKCLYDFFLVNINDILSESKNNKKEILIKCPECYNINNSGGIEFKNAELIPLIKEHLEKETPFEYSKTLNACILHDNAYDYYCDNSDPNILSMLGNPSFTFAVETEHIYAVPLLLSDENNKLVQVVAFTRKKEWVIPTENLWKNYSSYYVQPVDNGTISYDQNGNGTLTTSCYVGTGAGTYVTLTMKLYVGMTYPTTATVTEGSTWEFSGYYRNTYEPSTTRAIALPDVKTFINVNNIDTYYSQASPNWSIDGTLNMQNMFYARGEELGELINSQMHYLKIDNSFYFPAKRLMMNEDSLNSQTGVINVVSFLKEYENDSHIISYEGNKGTDNEIVSKKALNYGEQILNLRNFGVFSVLENENNHGGKNKIYKIYPHLIDKSLMHEIEQWRKTAGENGGELNI